MLEETGLEIKNARFVTATNDIMIDEGKHYVTIFVACEIVDPGAQPEVSFSGSDDWQPSHESKRLFLSRSSSQRNVRHGSGLHGKS